jgi:hypothetical protein
MTEENIDMQVGKNFVCRSSRKNFPVTAIVERWDDVYGCWRGSVKTDSATHRNISWYKNGRCLSNGSSFGNDLIREFREPRTFYAVEYNTQHSTTVPFGTLKTTKTAADNLCTSDTHAKRVVKFVEVIEDEFE